MNYFLKMNKQEYEKNISKMYFWNYFSSTSAIISPIVWVLYLALPNSTAYELGIFTTIAFVFWLLLEVLSWFISDIVWHKKVLLFFSISMILSNIFFIIPFLQDEFKFLFFTFWSIFLAIWLSFKSWSDSALLYETLEELWREKEFKIISAKMNSRVSIFSFITIIAIPFCISISDILPFLIALFFQIISFFICYSFLNPNIFERDLNSKIDFNQLKNIFRSLKWTFIIPISLFSWIILAAIDSSTRFRSAYWVEIWLEKELLWIVARTVPLFTFIFWHYIEIIEKYLNLKQILIINFINFSLAFYLFALTNNPYIFALMVWIFNWFYHRTYSIVKHKIIDDLPNKKYKATILSLRSQISMVFLVWLPILLWFLTNDSFKTWFMEFSFILFLLLIIPFLLTIKTLKN